MTGDWLADSRSEVAAQRILDAAGELFASQGAAAVGMHQIARAAGCSRATLYRYFDNREALHDAYVHRETRRLARELGTLAAAIPDPGRRLVEAVLNVLRGVRQNPALASWFAATQRPIGGQKAVQSDVIAALARAFVQSLGVEDPHTANRRGRWLMRVITSLLMFPGRDEDEERAMLEEFVAPLLTAICSGQATQ